MGEQKNRSLGTKVQKFYFGITDVDRCRSSKLWFQKHIGEKKLVRAGVQSHEFMKKMSKRKNKKATVQELKTIGLDKQTELRYKIKKNLKQELKTKVLGKEREKEKTKNPQQNK